MHWEGYDRSIWIDLIVRVYPNIAAQKIGNFAMSIGVYPNARIT